MVRRNRIFLTLAIILAIGIGVRAALPYVMKDYVNNALHGLQAYDGSIADIDLALWRGAYRIEGIRIDKRGPDKPLPFFSSDRVDLSVEWRSLFKGSLVSEVVFIRPNVNLIQEKTEEKSQLGQGENWQARLEQLFPFRFNTIEVRDGTVRFLAPGIRTQDALKAEHVRGTVTNLTNVSEANKTTFADFGMQATVLGASPAQAQGSLNPWAPQPTFDVNVQVKEVSLPKVNPWLREYIKADAESGDFELYLEIAAADGKFKGYAKPILRNVNITSTAEHEANLLKKLWEGIVEFAANVFENQDKEQLAARIPFSGSIQDPQAGIWATIVSVARNAFVGAFARSLEGSISLRDVKKNLGKYSADDDSEQTGKEASAKDADTKDANDKDADNEQARKRFGPRTSS
jgi:Domain of Unknown Function (DUF748)